MRNSLLLFLGLKILMNDAKFASWMIILNFGCENYNFAISGGFYFG